MTSIRPRLQGKRKEAFENLNKKEKRILVIGDLHAPFIQHGYLEFCQHIYNIYNCNHTIFIGDIIDNHYSSYHETDPNAMGGGDELSAAIRKLKPWKESFKKADVIIGNHDRMIMRRAFSSSIPKQWIKSYNDVLGTKWNWQDRIVYDNVQYVHGEGGTARTRAKNDMFSTCQGHIHTQAYVDWTVGTHKKIFGMQVGCGLDRESYAAAYAKNFKKQAIGVGIVIGGHTAFNCMMNL